MPGDFLDELIAKRAKRNPEFPKLVEAARRRRGSLKALADQRDEHEGARTIVEAMDTSRSDPD